MDFYALEYTTRRKGLKVIGIGKCNEVLDPLEITENLSKGSYKIRITICGNPEEVEVEVADSRKNITRYLYVPKDLLKAIIRLYPDKVVLEGEGQLKIVETIEVTDYSATHYMKERIAKIFYEDGDTSVYLGEEMISSWKEPKGRPQVRIETRTFSGGYEVCVSGDTYKVRKILKRHGFRWNGRIWCRIMSDQEFSQEWLNKFVRELEKKADVRY